METGLYEVLISAALELHLNELPENYHVDCEPIRNAEAANRLAFHLSLLVEQAVNCFPEYERGKKGLEIANALVSTLAAQLDGRGVDVSHYTQPGKVLREVTTLLPDGSAKRIASPLIPILDTTLLTNSPGEPTLTQQIQSEIYSADRIDVVMAFIRFSGIAPMLGALKTHCEQGKSLRVLTTTYTGTTEGRALDVLSDLGADVQVSYDVSGTRLHAKTWLFTRKSGFSTAYIGSSNLTHSAQVTGLEWNLRVAGVRNVSVIEKIVAVFDSYWNNADFKAFDPQEFTERTQQDKPSEAIHLSPVEIRLFPFQERMLEQIAVARQRGRNRNLLVAATGTGKTVMAAVDYARLATSLPRSRLLFVAHRQEILQQAQGTFAHAVRDASFGEMWVGGRKPKVFEHVFASVQSLNASTLDNLDPSHFDVVIIDEFHHAAAPTYSRLLEHLQPVQLLGLTATPERADGHSVLNWFGNRITAEMRLWDAIDQQRLVPFSYYGIFDGTDLTKVTFKRGRGYDTEELSNVLTADDAKARLVLKELRKRVGSLHSMRALGFCVSVAHAVFMARVFSAAGVKAEAVHAGTAEDRRKQMIAALGDCSINILFSVDLFNEGVDIPAVDTLLLLRPTESATLFLQQLGRGLRKHASKSTCTVLDFVGLHRAEFRYEHRFRALLGGNRQHVQQQVEQGMPFLPAGCNMQLDAKAQEVILSSIKQAIPSRWPAIVAEMKSIVAEHPDTPPSLSEFLQLSGLELEDIYKSNHCWTELLETAGVSTKPAGDFENTLRKAIGRLLHIDDDTRLQVYLEMLSATSAASEHSTDIAITIAARHRLQHMLLISLFSILIPKQLERDTSLDDCLGILQAHPQMVDELMAVFNILSTRENHLTKKLANKPEIPLQVHASYTRLEILAALHPSDNPCIGVRQWREGVYWAEHAATDVFVFTLDKTGGQFSPTTRYKDYAINPELIHWESQSTTDENSPTGQRYQQHAEKGTQVLLFARKTNADRSFLFLGPATYQSHERTKPMAITWKLEHKLPGDVYASFAAAVA